MAIIHNLCCPFTCANSQRGKKNKCGIRCYARMSAGGLFRSLLYICLHSRHSQNLLLTYPHKNVHIAVLLKKKKKDSCQNLALSRVKMAYFLSKEM